MNTGEKIARFYTAMTVGVVGVVMLVFYLLVSGYINRVSYARLSGAAGSVLAQDLPEAGPDMDVRVYPLPGVQEEVQLFLMETLSD
ncbi:MAG: hypothetical protein LUG98_05795, partial [Tannerellaceae bacterium]|nr:hypothetical protein [Tannerellaceae bacterium]